MRNHQRVAHQMKITSSVLGAILLVGAASVAVAHHGWNGQYDTSKEIELSGVIKSVQWTNPHVTFKFTVDGGKPTEKEWTVETNSVSALNRMNIDKSLFAVGSKIKVSGFGPVQGANFGLFMNHLLLANGKEVVFLRGAAPRWSDEVIGSDDALHGKVVENDINKRPSTVFSVWTTVYNDNNSHGMHVISTGGAAAPADGMAPAAGMDAGGGMGAAPAGGGMAATTADGKIVVCTPKAWTQEMGSPYPIQLIDQIAKSKKIILKVEENDTVREINITGAPHKAVGAPSMNGYSTGVLENKNKKLTVTTSNTQGSPDVVYTETFELSEDRNRLNYTLKSSTSPTVSGRYWQYQPGASVMPYGCTNAG